MEGRGRNGLTCGGSRSVWRSCATTEDLNLGWRRPAGTWVDSKIVTGTRVFMSTSF
jgi:hypothetical protein